MRFEHKGKIYEVAELTEPMEKETFGIIAIFEVVPQRWVKPDKVINITWDEYDDDRDLEKLLFVDYSAFYADSKSDIINLAKEVIDEKAE